MSENRKLKTIIVGGGLVGSLCACFMARRGYEVVLYEKRDDIREVKVAAGRSINLALSHRGRKALRFVDLEYEILSAAIPMKGRLLHGLSGELVSVPYDPVTNECIYSVGRNFLNQALLQAAEKYPNVKLHFHQKLVRSDCNEGTITLLNTRTYETYEDKADLIIGADGAFSSLRRSIQQVPLFEYSQKYIEHGYLELSIPSQRGDQMASNHLHIWPRGEFMMIALPNQDSSWTVTLFMPFVKFDILNTQENVIHFFKETFPDAVSLIGENELVETFSKCRPSTLVSIKCRPYHFGSKFLIIGDAAHAMVPFYGQGMNAGFEDCSLLNELFNETNDNIEETIRKFSATRVKNAHAICDLAMYNYEEMRSLVTKPTYYMRRTLDNVLFMSLSDKWMPLYNSISFSHTDYLVCLENRKWQDNVIKYLLLIIGIICLCIAYSAWTQMWHLCEKNYSKTAIFLANTTSTLNYRMKSAVF